MGIDLPKKNIKAFFVQQQRDQRKNDIASSKNTIIIRLKEILNFDKTTLDTFAEEIVKQFNEKNNQDVKIVLTKKLDYDIKTNTLMVL